MNICFLEIHNGFIQVCRYIFVKKKHIFDVLGLRIFVDSGNLCGGVAYYSLIPPH
jgi:hypothetical protein